MSEPQLTGNPSAQRWVTPAIDVTPIEPSQGFSCESFGAGFGFFSCPLCC